MLFLNKFLPLFVLPVGIVALLLVIALWRKQWWPGLLALAVLYLSSISFISGRLLGWVESRYPALPVASAGPADVIVVLGGILGPKVGEAMVPNFLDSSERFEGGLALLAATRADRLVFTGARMSWKNTDLTEGDELKRLAIARGAAASRIIVTREVVNTAGEAAAVAELMQAHGWKRVILVTTGWHMPRSAYLFKKAGVDCVIFPVDLRFDPAREVGVLDFVPKAEAWQQTETALRECYGYLFYRIFG